MIVYGWNSKVLKESPFPNQTCASCNSEDAHVVVSASYWHVFWIPIFPYKKQLTIVCGNCSLETKPKHVSEEVRQFAKKLKSTVRFPFYMFAGIGIIAVLIAVFAFIGFQDNQKMEEYLDNPQANDIYFLYDKEEPTELKYTLSKAVEVKGDSVYVTFNSFQYNYQPSRLESKDGFYDITIAMHKAALKEMYDKDEIRNVQRGFEPSSGFDRVVEFTEEDLQDLIKDQTEEEGSN